LQCIAFLIVLATAVRAGVEHRVVELEGYGIMVNVTENFDGTPKVSAQCLIPVTHEIVWRVLSDYENLDEMVPAVTESSIVGEEDGDTILLQNGRAGMWFVRRDFTVKFRVKEQPMYSIEFEAFEGDFERFKGVWFVKPMRSGTLVRHEVEVAPNFWAPGWALRRVAGGLMMETVVGIVGKCFELTGDVGGNRDAHAPESRTSD
jgi:ribosome-associated toxin RatA of RatAB toxin-antitoxin module